MYEDDVGPTWVFPGNIYNLVFSDKKNSNPTHFACMGYCGYKVLTKFWDFAAGMDFETSRILNKMSQINDLSPNNSNPPMFYENNHFDIYLTAIKP